MIYTTIAIATIVSDSIAASARRVFRPGFRTVLRTAASLETDTTCLG